MCLEQAGEGVVEFFKVLVKDGNENAVTPVLVYVFHGAEEGLGGLINGDSWVVGFDVGGEEIGLVQCGG